MKKTLFVLSLLGLGLASCSPTTQGTSSEPISSESPSSFSISEDETTSSEEFDSSEEDSSEEAEIEKISEKRTALCLGSVDKGMGFPTLFFNIAPDVPYFELDQFTTFFSIASGTRCLEAEGNTIHNTASNVDIVFDVEKNTISTTDLDQAINFSGTSIPGDPLTAKNDVIATIDESKSSYTKGKEITIKLSDYKAKLVEYNNMTFVPFSFLNAIFCQNAGAPIAFNGDDYYLMDEQAMVEKEDGEFVLTSYGESFYEGSLSEVTERSESYASYFYYSFLFQMQYFNGKAPVNLDAKLDELGLKEKMLSKDSKVADEALATAVAEIFHDGGHTAFIMRGMSCPFDVSENKRLVSLLDGYDSRYTSANEEYEKMKTLRGEKKAYEKEGSTAVIRFDSFDATSSFIERGQTSYPSIDTLRSDYESDNPSTFALLYFTFKDIEEDSSIKNVVFDVTMNGGGDTNALGYALSFMSDDPIKINFKNTFTGALYSEAVSYDNDLDKETDKDSYQGKYNFYILTSSFSFSCANAFPCIAKDNALAQIIGERSGGGDCAAKLMTSIEGSSYQTSGTASIRREDGTSVDNGQEVDYAYALNDFYDITKLNSFIEGLAA